MQLLTVTATACGMVTVAAASRAFEQFHPGVRVQVYTASGGCSRRSCMRAERMSRSYETCHDRHQLIIEQLTREARVALLPADHPLVSLERLRLFDLRK